MMHKDTHNMVFLLGGHDLEMDTIADIFGRRGILFFDNKLSWTNAHLSAYSKELSELIDKDVYGIELDSDIQAPANYHLIDHHGNNIGPDSSLELVANLIGHQLSDLEKLIAANDRGYIPAMEEEGATKKQIAQIRLRDRRAQGVSAKDERLEKDSLKEADTSFPGFIIAKSKSGRLSALEDLLFEKYRYLSHILYTDDELCIYGSVTQAFITKYKDSGIYYGGTTRKFAGFPAGTLNIKQIQSIIQSIKDMLPISKHIFFLPFEYSGDVKKMEDHHWKRVISPQTERDESSIFNEKQYFFPFVHKSLYDDGSENSSIRHYEWKGPALKYRIYVKSKAYTLDVDSISINLQTHTEIGVLSIALSNNLLEQSSPDDILKINQYGRRIMPPFFAEINDNEPRIELAKQIELIDSDGKTIVKEDFTDFKYSDSWKAGSFISYLVEPLQITPKIDDRMFVMCYYRNSEELERIAKFKPQSSDFSRFCLNQGAECQDFWYKYVFVDGDYATCYGEDMYNELLRRQTYSRWEHPSWGSEYGVSRYSLVLLTTDSSPYYLLDYFETIYARLVELILCQRAAILYYSDKARELAEMYVDNVDDNYKKTLEKLEISYELSRKYSYFVNHFCFQDVTSEDQGVELYNLLKGTLRIDEFEKELREKISLLHNQIKEESDKLISHNSYFLNILAGILLPITTLASVVSLWQLKDPGFCSGSVWGIFSTVLLVGITLSLILYRIITKKKYGDNGR